MSSGLLLPRHVHEATRAQRVAASVGAMAAATAIATRPQTTNRMDSDDFVPVSGVREQLAQLQSFIDAKREAQPGYHLPRPSGWKLLVLVLTIPKMTEGGLEIVDDSLEAKALSSPQGIVLAVGPGAYRDPARFDLGEGIVPWHKVGDRIIFVKYDAHMFQLANGQRLGFLNDTQPVATLDDSWEVPA